MSASEAIKKWGDDDNEDAFDRKTETPVDAQGIKIVTEFRTNERGQRVRIRYDCIFTCRFCVYVSRERTLAHLPLFRLIPFLFLY